jgi:hypothetical protein
MINAIRTTPVGILGVRTLQNGMSTALTLSTGATGPTGSTGPAGPTGPTGPSSVSDAVFEIYDNTTPTKKAIFQVSGISANTTRTYALPNNSGTLALTSDLDSYLRLDGGTMNGDLNFGSMYLSAGGVINGPGASIDFQTGEVTAVTFTPSTKPNVSGSRDGNAALESLLSALAGLGLITDSTS